MARSLKKGPFIDHFLEKKISFLQESKEKPIIKTWSRRSTILPEMIGFTFSIYNGRKHILIYIEEAMVGHKLGEFVPTRTFRSHAKSSSLMASK